LSRALPVLARWLDMPAGPLPGDWSTPRVQSPRFGASERFAVSPGREAAGYLHMPGGQSGHPLSPFYRAGHDAWVRGEPTPFLPGEPAHVLRLVPPGG
jgi:penicillin amidase